MNKLKQQLEELKNKLAELEKAIEEKEDWDWSPKMGETYFYINNKKDIMEYDWENDDIDNFALGKRNVYKTREEAQSALDVHEFCRKRSFRPDWKDEDRKKYFLYINHKDKEVVGDYTYQLEQFAPFYYPTREAVQEIIAKYTFKELAKYYGRI